MAPRLTGFSITADPAQAMYRTTRRTRLDGRRHQVAHYRQPNTRPAAGVRLVTSGPVSRQAGCHRPSQQSMRVRIGLRQAWAVTDLSTLARGHNLAEEIVKMVSEPPAHRDRRPGDLQGFLAADPDVPGHGGGPAGERRTDEGRPKEPAHTFPCWRPRSGGGPVIAIYHAR